MSQAFFVAVVSAFLCYVWMYRYRMQLRSGAGHDTHSCSSFDIVAVHIVCVRPNGPLGVLELSLVDPLLHPPELFLVKFLDLLTYRFGVCNHTIVFDIE
jgi:hypothetical protein